MNIKLRCIVVNIVLLWFWSAMFAQQPHASKRTQVHDGRLNSARLLPDLSASMELLSARVGPSVVQVFSTGYALEANETDANAGLFSRQRSFGSGIVISADGLILTNAHVIQGGRRVRVRLSNKPGSQPPARMLEAKVIALDRETDLALLKIDAVGLPFLILANSNDLKQGQLVLAFGSPLGLDNSVSVGVVSAVDRQLNPESPLIYIQTDAAINPGNSGGPLVDVNGQVVGINSFILSKSGGSEGVGFAIPSNLVRSVFNQMRNGGHVHHHQIGVLATTITPALATGLGLASKNGVLIEDVIPLSPAELAGLRIGDIVLGVGEKPIQNIRQFVLNLYESSVEASTKVDILRGTDRLSFEIRAAEREDPPESVTEMVTLEDNLIQPLGILVHTVDDQVASLLPSLRFPYGVVVAGRSGEGTYFGDRPRVGDVIHAVNGKPVTDVRSLREYLKELKADEPVVLQVEHSGRLIFLTFEKD